MLSKCKNGVLICITWVLDLIRYVQCTMSHIVKAIMLGSRVINSSIVLSFNAGFVYIRTVASDSGLRLRASGKGCQEAEIRNAGMNVRSTSAPVE
jgi:hypothetical protein